MSKREAAFHEAGHLILGYRSNYHMPRGQVHVKDSGGGVAPISLSRERLRNAGKSDATDRDEQVSREAAKIFCGGLVAENIAALRDGTIKPDEWCSDIDHRMAMNTLVGAGLPTDLEPYRTAAKAELEQRWPQVRDLADFLYWKGSTDTADIEEFLEDWPGHATRFFEPFVAFAIPHGNASYKELFNHYHDEVAKCIDTNILGHPNSFVSHEIVGVSGIPGGLNVEVEITYLPHNTKVPLTTPRTIKAELVGDHLHLPKIDQPKRLASHRIA